MFTPIAQINSFSVYKLTKKVAKQFQYEITQIWNLIPLSDHGINDILKEESDGKPYIQKWEHSLIVLSSDTTKVIGFIVGYERPKETKPPYLKDSIHLKSLSIAVEYQNQGLGRKLVQTWLDYNKKVGYLNLRGKYAYSVQTNSAEWNLHVQKLYQSFGFQKVGTKQYPDKLDVVYFKD